MPQSKHYSLNKWLNIKRTFPICICLLVASCSTATYKIVDSKGNAVQSVEGEAPGGDAATIVIYYGPDQPPSVNGKVNNEQFVKGTARIGRAALTTALKFAAIP